MFVLKATGCAAAAAIAAVISVGSTKAAVYSATHYDALTIEPDGRAEHHNKVIGPRMADEDCKSKTVTKKNEEGDTKSRTTTKCD